jgi:hypothetical protein
VFDCRALFRTYKAVDAIDQTARGASPNTAQGNRNIWRKIIFVRSAMMR